MVVEGLERKIPISISLLIEDKLWIEKNNLNLTQLNRELINALKRNEHDVPLKNLLLRSGHVSLGLDIPQ
mgnify:CR=1 FL=1